MVQGQTGRLDRHDRAGPLDLDDERIRWVSPGFGIRGFGVMCIACALVARFIPPHPPSVSSAIVRSLADLLPHPSNRYAAADP